MFTDEQVEAITQQIVDARVSVLKSYDPTLHFARAGEMATLAVSTDKDGYEAAVEILQATVNMHPNDFGRQFMLAGLLIDLGRDDDSIEIAKSILDEENQTVGLHAIELFSIRPLFAQLLVQLYLDKFQDTENEEEKLALVTKARQFREELYKLVSGKEDNQLLLYSDGIIALADGNYSLAAEKLEETIHRDPSTTARVYRLAAFALAKTNARGLAIEFLQAAIEKEPSNLANYIAKAQLEIQLSDERAASLTLSVLPADIREREDVQVLLNLIAMQRSDSATTAFSDPSLRTISKSEQLSKSRDFEEAILVLEEAIDRAEEPDWRLFVATSNVYYKMDDNELAIEWLEKAIELIPNPSILEPQLHILKTTNRVDALISLIESQVGTDAEKAEELAVSLYELGINYLGEANRWTQLGSTMDATEAKEISDLALAESKKYQVKAESLDADMSRIIALRFNDALLNEEFDVAESHVEELVTHDAKQSDIDSSRISLHLAKAIKAKNRGQLDVYNSHTSKALTLAEKMVEADSISDFSWRALGRVLVEIGEIDEAINAYAEAYRISPKNKDNIRQYVAVLAAGQQTENQRLLRVLRIAKEQYSLDRQIRTAWLEAERQFGEPWKVLVFRMNQIALAPGDRTNALELAYLLTITDPERTLLRNLEGVEVYSARIWAQMTPKKQESVLSNARVEWDRQISETLLKSSEVVDPNIRIANLHASIHRNLGQLERSSEIWDRFIESVQGTEKHTTAVIAAADFLYKSSRTAQAVRLLENARESQSTMYEIDAVLGTLHYTGGLFNEAAEYLKVPVEATKDSVLHSRLIESLALAGRFEEAEKSLLEYTTTNTAYAEAVLKALISRVRSEQLLAQGDVANGTIMLNTYRNALRDAISADARSQMPYIRLCKSLLIEYRLTQNKALLEEALLVADEATATGNLTEQFAVVRADVLQADGQLNRSIDRLSRYLADHPGSSTVRQRLIEAYLDSENVDRALAVAKAGVEVDSSDALWHQRLGDLYLRANDDRVEGVKAYLAGIQKTPTVGLLLRIDEITRTDQQLPNEELLLMSKGPLSKLHPIAGAIEAKALQNLGRNRDALLAMKRSWRRFQQAIDKGWIPPQALSLWFLDLQTLFKEDPSAGEAFVRELANGSLSQYQLAGLANFYYAFGDDYVEYAIEILQNALASTEIKQDARIQHLMMLGGILVDVNRFEESESTFRKLAEESDSPFVQNNLAYVIGVYQSRPEEGLIIAKEAAKNAPREPSIVDTVATMYHRLGEYDQAAKTLDYLLLLEPTNSKVMAKLSLLYSDKLGEPERGLVFAERGRSQNPRSSEVLDAIGWSYYRMGKMERAEDSIRRSLRQGDTMEAYLHLAQIVTEDEEFDEALGHLRMAQELAEDAFSMKRIQALKDDIRKKKNESQRVE